MNILQEVAKYCAGNPDTDTMNKISEVVSLTAMSKRGRLRKDFDDCYKEVLAKWVDGEPTTREFKSVFRKKDK